MKYITIGDEITKVLALGPGTLLAKIDVRSAFRLLPVHLADISYVVAVRGIH